MNSLIVVEAQRPVRAFDNKRLREPAQHRGLVILRRIQLRDDCVIFIDEVRFASWTDTSPIDRICQARVARALDAEDVAGKLSADMI